MRCEGCGAEPDEFVIRDAVGGLCRIVEVSRCTCPVPCCFACHRPIDDEGRCTTTLCFMDGLIVPIPELV